MLDAESALFHICRLAGVSLEQVLHIHMSPPCETFSPAGATCSTRSPPCHYRIPGHPLAEVRQDDSAYAMKARQHDALVQHLLSMLKSAIHQGYKFNFSIENPRGLLQLRPYMQLSSWKSWCTCSVAVKRIVDYCAFGTLYRKATNIWTNLIYWQPRGSTGDGRCRSRCGQGGWTKGASGRPSFRHHQVLAQDPVDGVTGKGANKIINAIPQPLTQELLQASLQSAHSPDQCAKQ